MGLTWRVTGLGAAGFPGRGLGAEKGGGGRGGVGGVGAHGWRGGTRKAVRRERPPGGSERSRSLSCGGGCGAACPPPPGQRGGLCSWGTEQGRTLPGGCPAPRRARARAEASLGASSRGAEQQAGWKSEKVPGAPHWEAAPAGGTHRPGLPTATGPIRVFSQEALGRSSAISQSLSLASSTSALPAPSRSVRPTTLSSFSAR